MGKYVAKSEAVFSNDLLKILFVSVVAAILSAIISKNI